MYTTNYEFMLLLLSILTLILQIYVVWLVRKKSPNKMKDYQFFLIMFAVGFREFKNFVSCRVKKKCEKISVLPVFVFIWRGILLLESLLTSHPRESGRMYAHLKAHKKLIARNDTNFIQKCLCVLLNLMYFKICPKIVSFAYF